MKYLFSAWETIKHQIGTKALLMFFDFDGTLAPISSSPDEAQIPHKTRDLLADLSRKPSCKVAVISGRELTNIKSKVGLPGIVYAGNHGLEIEGPKLRHTIDVGVDYPGLLKKLKTELVVIARGFPGAFVEDKGLSLSVHFRGVDLNHIIEMRTKIRAMLMPYSVKGKIKVRTGKMVIEIRPPVEWDKGRIVLWLIARWQTVFNGSRTVSLYCGDDATDEDAFRALKNEGITVVVGPHDESAAHYYVNAQEEVNELLVKINETMR